MWARTAEEVSCPPTICRIVEHEREHTARSRSMPNMEERLKGLKQYLSDES